ncbi:hypothetical protein BVRB_1g000100 isoform B [Beta vulgaris subsp. vulgaris]|nr:hypothetical protein BVRB_1g000100 isoform B [Beta vulgaris subsp. vulgaris]
MATSRVDMKGLYKQKKKSSLQDQDSRNVYSCVDLYFVTHFSVEAMQYRMVIGCIADLPNHSQISGTTTELGMSSMLVSWNIKT